MAVQGGAGTEALTGQGLTETGKETESKAQKQVVGGDRKPASRRWELSLIELKASGTGGPKDVT